MATQMVGGPFDGQVATFGDPGVPSIWPAVRDGVMVYREYQVEGRPKYVRDSPARYVFADLKDLLPSQGVDVSVPVTH